MFAPLETAVFYIVPFLLVLTLVVTVHELGHFLMARALGIAVDQFSIGFGRAIFRWTDRWGVEWRVGWLPLGGYVKFSGDGEPSSMSPDPERLAEMRARILEAHGPGADRRYFHFKPVWGRALVVAAGPFANFALAIVIFAVLLSCIGEVAVTPRVGGVLPNSPAARAGFKAGDLLTRMNATPVADFRDVRQYVALRTGEPIRFAVRRGGQDLTLVATPERHTESDAFTDTTSRLGYLGLEGSSRRSDYYIRRFGPLAALKQGVVRTWGVIDSTILYLERLVRGRESADALGGPLKIAMVAHSVAQSGAEGATTLSGKLLGGGVALLSLAAVLSVGIGFMNLMPIPVLDGGHLVFYAYEACVRRPVHAQVQGAGYRVGLALLLGFMLFATWNELSQMHAFKFVGGLFS
jgi:regulator of sigma E protease